MATIIISLLLLLLIILALRSIRKEESCSGGCSGCSKGCKSGQARMRPISREKSSRYDIEILSLLSSHSRLSIVLKRGIELLLLHITALDFPVFIASSPHENLILYEYAILPACTKSHAPIGDVKAVGQCDGSIARGAHHWKTAMVYKKTGPSHSRCQDMFIVCAAFMAVYKK